MKSSAAFLAVLVCLGTSVVAQTQSALYAQDRDRIPTSAALNQTPTYSVNVVSRTTGAVKYEHRRGSTKIDFEGTA